MYVRVIPRLDIKGPNLVKGVHMEGLRVLGKPEHFARHYYENGADELYYMDAVASLYERNSLVDIIERTTREIFIPLTVGGGLRSVEDIRTVLRAGADKVSINTAAVKDPALVTAAAERFGSQCIVVNIDPKRIRGDDGERWEVFINGGRTPTGHEAVAWAKEVEALGAGEIVLTCMDADGTKDGYDLEMTRAVSDAVTVPVVASGGAGCPEHLADAVTIGGADAALAASIFHFGIYTIQETKDRMAARGVRVRRVQRDGAAPRTVSGGSVVE